MPLTATAARSEPVKSWLVVAQPPLEALLSMLLAGSGKGGTAEGAALPLLLKLCRAIKLARDVPPVDGGVDCSASLHGLADVVTALLVRTSKAAGWDTTQQYTGAVPLPLKYLRTALESGQPLSPRGQLHTPAHPHFLPSSFELLPDAELPTGAAPAARKRAVPRASKAPAAKRAKAKPAAVPKEGNAPPSTRPRRAAAKKLLAVDSSSDGESEDDSDVGDKEQPLRKVPAPRTAAPLPACGKPPPLEESDDEENDDVEAEIAAGLRPKRAAPKPAPMPAPLPPPVAMDVQEEEDDRRISGRQQKRR